MNDFNKLFWLSISAFVLTLAFSSCKKDDVVQPENDEVVYMSFQMAFSAKNMATRSQGDNPSINTDDDDQEDYVNKLAVLVFESAGTGAKIAEEYTSASFFKMKMKPGTYDFYFIANYTDTDAAIAALASKAAVDAYLQSGKAFASYQGAKTDAVLFPMARVYRSQSITVGGTFYAPLPFNPQVGTVADKQLKPVSFFWQDWQGASTQQTVNLVRANAKISLNIGGEGKSDVAKLEYVNAAQNYTFAQMPEASLPDQSVAATQAFSYNKPAAGATENIVTRLYVPERLFAATETTGWDTTADAPQGMVNYIRITMTSGNVYRIPVVTNTIPTGTKYLDIARDNTQADYNVIRNNHYLYNITIPMDAKEIVVTAVVLPWTLVESEISFGQTIFNGNFSFPEQGGGEVLDDNQTVLLHQQSAARIVFKLSEPKGAIWRATLTNGLDFSLTPDPDSPNGAVYGIADPNTEYSMLITPLKPFEGTPRVTEFYITVNGEEIPFVSSTGEIGPGKRAVFKQVE